MADNELDVLIKFLVDNAGTLAAVQALERQFNQFQESIEEAKKSARELKGLSKEVAQASREAFLIGTAITGGIFAAANKYVKDAKEATAVTVAWKAAQDQLNRSGNRIGAILAQEALPLLERAAVIADKVAGFVEDHPEIVRAAINTGLVVASLGAIGVAVSKGIRLSADIAYLAAVAKEAQGFAMFDRAVNKFLGGTAEFAGAGATKGAAGAGTIAGAASSVGLIIAGVIASKYAVDLTNIVLQKTGLANSIADAQQKILETSKRPYPGIIAGARPEGGGLQGLLKSLGLIDDAAADASNSLENAAANLGSVANSPAFDQIIKAYDQYRREDLQATQDHLNEKKRVEDNAREATKKANDQYAAAVTRINTQTTGALIQAAKQLDEANRQAEIQNAEQRAQIIRDGGEEIKRIETNLQEDLRKARIEHDQRTQDLTAARDALGLAKENSRHALEESEKQRAANLEIRARRADIAQRLDDLQRSYEQERAQRFADYEARTNEIKAQAAAELSQLAAQHREEIAEIQRNKVARIREMDNQFAEERRRRVNQFLQTIRDLDATLLGEKNLKDRYYTAMIVDLDRFLAGYKAKLASLAAAPAPGMSTGGYAAGLVRTGEKGYEYILSNRTTKAAENIIGGRLTQDGLIAALVNATGGRSSIVWNDQRRFDGAYTNEIRRAVHSDTLSTLAEVLS